MQKPIFTLLIFLNTLLFIYAQNVGIGVNNPGSKLQVIDNAVIGYNIPTNAPANGLLVNGNLGIGVLSPSVKLHVDGNAAFGYTSATAAPTNGLLVNGMVGVGTTAPSEYLTVDGDISISSLATVSGTKQVVVNADGLLELADEDGLPIGAVMPFAGSTPPAGWLLCNGQSTASYPALAAVVGATVPDLRDRRAIGTSNLIALASSGGSNTASYTPSGTIAGTVAFAGTSVTTNGGTPDGAHTHTIPAHNHNVSVTASNGTSSSAGASTAVASTSAGGHFHSFTVAYSGAHQGTGAPKLHNGGNSDNRFMRTVDAGAHTHTVNWNHTHTMPTSYTFNATIGNGTTNASDNALTTASGGAHTHTYTAAGTVTTPAFNGTTVNIDVTNKYIVLNYIIKYQ